MNTGIDWAAFKDICKETEVRVAADGYPGGVRAEMAEMLIIDGIYRGIERRLDLHEPKISATDRPAMVEGIRRMLKSQPAWRGPDPGPQVTTTVDRALETLRSQNKLVES